MKTGAVLISTGLLVACVASQSFAESVQVFIAPLAQRAETDRCAHALLDAKDMLSEPGVDLSVKLISGDEFEALDKIRDTGWRAKPGPQIIVTLDQRRDYLSLHGVPFAFRDATHFSRYAQSPIGKKLFARLFPKASLAYGGFAQLFSRKAAITMPQHFYGRTVSGDADAMTIYHEFGARPGVSLSGFAMADLTAHFDQMRTGNPVYDIVEAPLSGAVTAGADRAARFVNLTSSSVMPIVIDRRGDEGVLDNDKLDAWAEAAAMNCSRSNYDAEIEALERLKRTGVQIVPFNRSAVVETSWRLALEQAHRYWTVDEFDEVERLGAPSAVQLPSAVLAKMPREKRAKAVRFDQEAMEERKKSDAHLADVELEKPIEAIERASRAEFAAAISTLPPPAPPRDKPDRPKAIDKSSAAYAEISRLASQLENEMQNCGKCSYRMTGWSFLARVYTALGDSARVTNALDQALAKVDSGSSWGEVMRIAAIANDDRARKAADELLAKASAAINGNVKREKFPLGELLLAARLLSDLDENTKARDLLTAATQYVHAWGNDRQLFELATAQWYVGQSDAAWSSLREAVRRERYPQWPLIEVSKRSGAEANRAFAPAAAARLEKMSAALLPLWKQASPEDRSKFNSWAMYLERAGEIEVDYGMRTRAEQNLRTLTEVAKNSNPNDAKDIGYQIADLSKRLASAEPRFDAEAGDPNARVEALIAQLEKAANLDSYLR